MRSPKASSTVMALLVVAALTFASDAAGQRQGRDLQAREKTLSEYVLRAEDADLSEAPDVIVEGSPPNLSGWRVGNKVSFTVDLKKPGAYTIFLNYSKEKSAGDKANLRMTFKNEESGSSTSFSMPLPSTGNAWGNYTDHELCSVFPVEAGKTIVSLESANPEGDGYVMNLRAVTIR